VWWKVLHLPGRALFDRNAGPSVTDFSRHLPDRPFPLLAIAGRLSGTRFARTTLVDAGSRSAKGAARIALPFRLQGNDAAKRTGGDMRGKVLR